MKRLVAAALLATLAACDDEKAGNPDELTIIVQADRREVEQQEKVLREREESLAKDKSQLDQRIADLAKGLKAAADAEQRRRLEEELRQSQALEGQLGVRVTFSTNGTLIDQKKAERLAKIGVTYVGISIDGNEERRVTLDDANYFKPKWSNNFE